MASEKPSVMRTIRIGKITLNVGTGKSEEMIKKAKILFSKLTDGTPVATKTTKRIASWGLRPGLEVGCKVTIRKNTEELLKKLLEAKDNTISAKKFDDQGNFSFGIAEYIDIPGLAYDPELKLMGLNVAVTLVRPGYRLKWRKIRRKAIGKTHRISREEAIAFIEKKFNVTVER
jgi:large subunit ribosomal protein L5